MTDKQLPYKVTEAIQAIEEGKLKTHELAQLVACACCKNVDVFKQMQDLMGDLKAQGKLEVDEAAKVLPATMDWIAKKETTNIKEVAVDVDGEEDVPESEQEPEPECILQFSTAVYYAKEGDDAEMSVDVMRLGNSDGECKCKFTTEDGDGKAGQRYEAVSGELTFAPGEVIKQILIPIIDSRAWSAALEFKIVLSDVEGAILGRYLWLCRVKVIDPDCFPTNKYEDFIRNNDWGGMPLWGLLREYFKFNYVSVPLITRRSKWQLATDQLSNMYFILRLYIGKVLVDKVLNPNGTCDPGTKVFGIFPCPDGPDDQIDKKLPVLLTLCFFMVVPLVPVHYAEYREVFFKLGGTSRKTIQGNLVRKFLNYDESARTQLAPSDLIMAVTRDTQFVVHDGFMQLYPLAQNAGKLFLVIVLQLILGAHLAIVPVLIYPCVLVSLICYRDNLIAHLQHEQDDAQNELVGYVTQIMTGYRLIGDYLKRPDAVEETEKRIGKFNGKMINSDAANLNNRYAALWLANLVTGIWYIIGGRFVIEGSSDLGTFLMNLQVFQDVGIAWTVIFGNLVKMQNALPYLQKVVRYMNLPADLEKRMTLNRRRRALGEDARNKAREVMNKVRAEKGGSVSKFAADYVPIQLRGLEYSFEPLKANPLVKMNTKQKLAAELAAEAEKTEKPKDGNLRNITLEITQGQLVALVGKPGNGKSTLMRLIGAQLIPDAGDLLIPPHLRVLHISKQPVFFNDTLFNNLTYGVSKSDKTDGDANRVRNVCKVLMVSERIFKYLDPERKDEFSTKAEWSEVLSQTQSQLLSLARAFITNPEILVIHKPTVVFDDATTDNTFKCLRQFVENKGLCLPKKSYRARRPRTCLITTARPKGVALADKVFTVTPEGVIEREVGAVTQDMLA